MDHLPSQFRAPPRLAGANFDVVTLTEAQRRVRNHSNNRPTVAITFDDGYAENCDFAIPELQRRHLPATYFVATTSVSTGTPFAHDLQLNCPLTPNTISEVQDIAAAGFEIGGHTRNHVNVGALTEPATVEDELLGGIQELESWGVGPIRHFSFPFGLPANTSQLAVDILMRAGLASFCSAYGAWNWPGSPGYHLRRIHGDPGMQTLKNWLTLDPRKLRERQVLPFTEPRWPQPAASVVAEPVSLEQLSAV
jgi:peptidoglycan/xylan/chitin deacetylase (PgdA/CDA1 family)